MKTLALLHFLAFFASQGGQSPSQPKVYSNVLMITEDRVYEPTKELLKPLSPVDINDVEGIVKAAIAGDLVVKSKDFVAIYKPSALRQFPNYAFLLAAKAFNAGGQGIVGRTDRDDWARLLAVDLISPMNSPAASIALQRLDANGFAEHPGEVILGPAYKVEIEIAENKIVLLASANVSSEKFSSYLGKGFSWSTASQVTTREEHVYSTFRLTAAKLERRIFDEKIAEALKSSKVFKECSRAVRDTLSFPFNTNVEFSSFPDHLQRRILLVLPGRLRLLKIDPAKYSVNDIKRIKVIGSGLSANMAVGFNNKESFTSLDRALPNP